MVTINELYIPRKGNSIILKASVKTASYYDNVYIDKVYVDTQDTYANGSFSDCVYSHTCGSNTKDVNLEITALEMKKLVQDNLFIIRIVTTGTPSSDTPCGMDNQTTIGVVFDVCKIYDSLMHNIKELDSPCEISKNSIDVLLQYEMFKVSSDIGHVDTAISLYKKFFKDFVRTIKTCGCNG